MAPIQALGLLKTHVTSCSPVVWGRGSLRMQYLSLTSSCYFDCARLADSVCFAQEAGMQQSLLALVQAG